MESQCKPGSGDGKEVMVANKRGVTGTNLILRILGFALTLVAAIVLGIGKQTKVVPIALVSTLPPINVPVTAKWYYLSAFTYFVVANAVACAYAAISLLFVLANRAGKKKGLELMVIVFDLLMMALLFSSGGAAFGVGLIGYEGNSHVRWNKVCNVFDKFCHQVAAAIAISLLGSAVFLLLVLLAVLNLHKKHQ